MIKIQLTAKTRNAKVTFSIDSCDLRLPASVAGDFNGWDPDAHPLKKGYNGIASATLDLKPGTSYAFRYRVANGFFHDDQVTDRRPNSFGTNDCVLTNPG